MAIRFYNIHSGEERTCEDEPQIAAFWASSDHSPNITQGQDFGWRLAPAVAVELSSIKQDQEVLEKIARRLKKEVEEVNESDILMYISSKTPVGSAPVGNIADYQGAYDQEIKRALDAKEKALAAQTASESTTATTTESLADMEKRAELAERIAKANAEAAKTADKTPEQSPPATTTTTTVQNPTTTTTTTRVK